MAADHPAGQPLRFDFLDDERTGYVQELSTVEAANFLNVSRPFVIKEIESKRLACRMVGSHRRIAFDDLQAYASKMRADQKGALQRMADNARELGLDY